MSDAGTSLESLESGNVANAADEARMAAILRDMQATEEPTMRDPMPSNIPMPTMHPNPPTAHSAHSSPQNSQYVPVEDQAEPVDAPLPIKAKRGNIWNRILSNVRDPLIVAVLMFVLSLPGFHSVISKVVPWAFAVGGELSYLGLIVKSVFAGGLFALLQLGASFI
jgi:hypothetical protein